MSIRILTFGRTAEATGVQELTWHDVPDTDALQEQLHQQYPALRDTRYMIAVDKQVIHSNTALNNGATVALLPPFSGG